MRPVKLTDNEDPSSHIRYVNLYEAEDKIYTRRISGFFQKIRRYTGIPLMLGFLLLPWFVIDGRPAMLFDIPERKFHVLWMTFWPQDFFFLAWALIIAAFSLFTVTVLLGRVYCGFTCPQTVWTLIFMSIEHFCEGDRNKRIKLDKQGWTKEKIVKKTAKHSLWVLVAFVTGLTFIGYFVPIRDLIAGFVPTRLDSGMLTLPGHPVAIFWTLFFTGATYLNAGWMREQVCKYMCPYARFQAVMYDSDTLAVHYDFNRGEKRGPRKPNDDYKQAGLGDCIDCSWCVQVCPVNIDIRDGLQYECINCGLCVDACNAVMEKMSYPKGLIRYASEDELKTGKTHFFRPRLFGYCAAVLAMVCVFAYTMLTRTPLTIDVIKDRGVRMYRLSGTEVQNVYTLKINNMDEHPHTYRVSVDSELPFKVSSKSELLVEAGEAFTYPLRLALPKNKAISEKMDVVVVVTAQDNDKIRDQEQTIFMAPVNK